MESKGNLPYYHMVEELREKLRISEEGRKSLQQKFDAMMQTYKVKEQARYNALRKRYGAFLEEDQRRQQRNENLLQMLERIDNRSASLAARTERLALLRKHYEQYLGHIYPSWKVPHRLAPVKIREYHEEDVSGYGTHTGSSGYVRESERYEEPRMPPMSTPRASTHLYKTDNVLPDKYRIPRVDFDVPTISIAKPDEKRPSFEVRTQGPKVDLGATRSTRQQLTELEVDQNTSGDLLNMSLSDDGVPSLTRSETDVVARHQHWETLRQAYINRQQPAYNEQSSADESSQDMGWSRERTSESERPLEQDQLSQEVSVERESFRDKIRRLKVMIQENKELEQAIVEPVNGDINNDQRERKETDNAFQQQRVRQALVNPLSSENVSRPGDGNLNDNDFQHQRVGRQSGVGGQGLIQGSMDPQSSENDYSRPEEKTLHHQENLNGERKMPEGTLRRRMSVLPAEQIRPGDRKNDKKTEQQNWVQGSEQRPGSLEEEQGRYMPEQQRQLEPLRESERQEELRTEQTQPQLLVERKPELRNEEARDEKQGSEERPLYQEELRRKQSVDSVQNMQYMEQNRDYNTNTTNQNRYTTEQPARVFIGIEQGKEKQETNRYPEGGDFGSPDSQNNTHPPDSTSEQYYQNNSACADNREQPQEQGFYDDPNRNYDGQGHGYNYNQDVQYDYQYQTNQPDGNYYSQQQDQGENASQGQKTYAQSNDQEYYQPSNGEYDPNQQYPKQYANQQQYDLQQQHAPQQYNLQQQHDTQLYDPQQQHDTQPYDPQQQQDTQPYDPQQQHDTQLYDPQQQHDFQPYDPQQQHDSRQYDPEQQLYGGDSYGWQGNSNQREQQPGGTQEPYQYYGQQNQEAYGYDPQNQGRNGHEYPQQNPNGNYSTVSGSQQEETGPVGRDDGQENQPRGETYYQDISDESTQESDRSRELPTCKKSPSQKSIDRYRTMLGVDSNSDPAFSEVDEIEDEMAAVVASGTGTGRMQAADIQAGQNQSKPLQTNPKQLHDDSSDFDYSSGP